LLCGLLRCVAPRTGIGVFRIRLIGNLSLWLRRFQGERPGIVAAGEVDQRFDTRLDRRMGVENIGKTHARVVDAHFHHG
jgi:hypothetical protein